MHICIVDDDPQILELHEILINNMGFKTISFSDADAAMLSIIAHPSKVLGLITDAYLYNKYSAIHTGHELSTQILQTIPDLPILFCTALNGAKEIASMLQIGHVCNKPLDKHLRNQNSAFFDFMNDIITRQHKIG